MAAKLLAPIPPGEILFEDFMKPLGLSINALARDIDVSPNRISEIMGGKRAVTADTALRLGRVQLIFEPMPSMLPHVRAGRMKALGVTTAKRSNAAPEIPTIAEQGLEGFDVVTWYGMLAPAGTPKPVLETLHAAIVEFAALPDVRERLSSIGAEPATLSSAEFAAMIKRDVARWKGVAREANIKLD